MVGRKLQQLEIYIDQIQRILQVRKLRQFGEIKRLVGQRALRAGLDLSLGLGFDRYRTEPTLAVGTKRL